MKQILHFLERLSRHNEREWFNAHKEEYVKARDRFTALTGQVLDGIRRFDDRIGLLDPAACCYRIYRDLRFSKDKTPYKTHMGFYINPGGKKSGYSGYYFHVDGTGHHLLAVGDIFFEPAVLKILREDIEMGGGDFRQILAAVDPRLHLDREGALKRVPNGFPADSPDAEYLKLKSFCLVFEPDEDFIRSPGLAGRLVEIFRTTKPFLDYLNRAIAFSRDPDADSL